jgi:hypothetical protein
VTVLAPLAEVVRKSLPRMNTDEQEVLTNGSERRSAAAGGS